MEIGRCEVAERSSGLPHTKKSRSARLVPAPFSPKLADRPQNSLNVVTHFDLSMYTEFGPDRLRFAGLIPEIDFFGSKSQYNYIGFQPTNICSFVVFKMLNLHLVFLFQQLELDTGIQYIAAN